MPPTSSPSLFPDLLRLALILCHTAMILVAVAYLRHRKLTLAGYILWGLFAALIPFLGPFLVIYLHPGTALPPQEHTPGPGHRLASLFAFLRKLDPGAKR